MPSCQVGLPLIIWRIASVLAFSVMLPACTHCTNCPCLIIRDLLLSFEASHPITLSANTIARVLRGVVVKDGEGSWETWLRASRRPFERLGTRTLSTWRRYWPRDSPELRRTSRLDFVLFKWGRPRNRRRVSSTPTDGHCRTYPRCFSARWSSSPAKSTASAISRIDFRKSILCRWISLKASSSVSFFERIR